MKPFTGEKQKPIPTIKVWALFFIKANVNLLFIRGLKLRTKILINSN